MRKIMRYAILPAVLLAASCIGERFGEGLPGDGEELLVRFNMSIPGGGGSLAAGRAMSEQDESAISTVDVLAFYEDGNGDFRYGYPAADIRRSITGDEMLVTATVKGYVTPQQFVVLVNASAELATAGIVPNEKLPDAMRKIVCSTGGGEWPAGNNGTGAFVPIPMYAKTGAQVVTPSTGTIGDYPLVRMVARIDVTLAGAVGNFELKEAMLFNYMTAGYVPYDFSGFAGSTATVPAVPASGLNPGDPILEPAVTFLAANSGQGVDPRGEIIRSVYTFESPAITTEEGMLKGTALVIGGYYGGNTTNMVYYRVDLKTTDDLSANKSSGILRNHHYRIEIQSVAAPGAGTPIDAYMGAKPIDFTVEVTPWGENKEVILPFPERSSNCFIATTGGSDVQIPVYNQIFWAIQNGDLPNNWLTKNMTLGTEIIWAENTDNIRNLSLKSAGYALTDVLRVSPGTVQGNAVVGVYNDANSNGVRDTGENILWSWHIWVLNAGNIPIEYGSGGFMDRDLGALRAGSWQTVPISNAAAQASADPVKGLSYQYGRKDPMPNGRTPVTGTGIPHTIAAGNTIDFSIKNPTVHSNNWGINISKWATTKTVYDPCPAGWRIASQAEWATVTWENYAANSFMRVTSAGYLPLFFVVNSWAHNYTLNTDGTYRGFRSDNNGGANNSFYYYNHEIVSPVRCIRDGSGSAVTTPILTTDYDEGKSIATDGKTYTINITSNTEWEASVRRGTDAVTAGDTSVMGEPLLMGMGFGGSTSNSYITGNGNESLDLTTVNYTGNGQLAWGKLEIIFRDKATGMELDRIIITVKDTRLLASGRYAAKVDALSNGTTGNATMTWAVAMGISTSNPNYNATLFGQGELYTPTTTTGCGGYWEDNINDSKSGQGKWRLPTEIELQEMHQRRDEIGGFMGSLYWSAAERNAANATPVNFGHPSPSQYKPDNFYARCVRDID